MRDGHDNSVAAVSGRVAGDFVRSNVSSELPTSAELLSVKPELWILLANLSYDRVGGPSELGYVFHHGRSLLTGNLFGDLGGECPFCLAWGGGDLKLKCIEEVLSRLLIAIYDDGRGPVDVRDAQVQDLRQFGYESVTT